MMYGTEADYPVHALRAVMSRFSVVADATYDGDSRDSNSGHASRVV